MRIFLVDRQGNGTEKTPFAPAVPDNVYWWGYTIGTKFLIVTESDVTAIATEITLLAAIRAACVLYGITPAHLKRAPDGSVPPDDTTPVVSLSLMAAPVVVQKTSLTSALKQWWTLAMHILNSMWHHRRIGRS